MQEETKIIADAFSIATIVATFFNWLPHIAALLSVIWMLIRIYETPTVQRLLKGKDRRNGNPATKRKKPLANEDNSGI